MEDLTTKGIDVSWVLIAVSREVGDDLQYFTGASAAGFAAA